MASVVARYGDVCCALPAAVSNDGDIGIAAEVGTNAEAELATAVGCGLATAASAVGIDELERAPVAVIELGTKPTAAVAELRPFEGVEAKPAMAPVVGDVRAVIPTILACSCCIFFWSFSFCVSANLTTSGAEQPSMVRLWCRALIAPMALCFVANVTKAQPLLCPFWSRSTVHSSMVPWPVNSCLTSASLYFLFNMPTKSLRSGTKYGAGFGGGSQYVDVIDG